MENVSKVILDNAEISVVWAHSDAKDFSCGLCGKTNIGNLYTVTNKEQGMSISVGSHCVNKFTELPSWDTYITHAKGILAILPNNGVSFKIKVPYGHEATTHVRSLPSAKWDYTSKAYVVSYADFPKALEIDGIQVHSDVEISYGFFLVDTPEEQLVVEDNRPLAYVKTWDNVVSFYFPYNESLKDTLKRLGARFDGVDKSWFFPDISRILVDNRDALINLVRNIQSEYPQFKWDVNPKVVDLLVQARESKPGATITLVGGKFIFNSPYNAELKNRLKVFGSRFNGDTKAWETPALESMSSAQLKVLAQIIEELDTTYNMYDWDIQVDLDVLKERV